jgi:hydrogenase-1 operon protein HyaF
MTPHDLHKPFPVPVRAFGPGSQPDEESIDVMPLPRAMSGYRAPQVPAPQLAAAHAPALALLHRTLDALRRRVAGEAVAPIEIGALGEADRLIVNQILGEGEVSAQATGTAAMQAQEAVFAGVWRVVYHDAGAPLRDTIEVGAFPQAVAAAARRDALPVPPLPAALPPGTMNAPALLAELRQRAAAWQPGAASQVLNLTLLPLSAGDRALLEALLGHGKVLVLSRGYGNCRIVNTRADLVWRVTYYNSQDVVILDTFEVGDVPEVASAASQDLEDSVERLAEVLQWMEAS